MSEITLKKKEVEELKKWSKYGKLLSGVIHNINSPIMGISGRLDLMKFKNPDLKGLDKMGKNLEKINLIISNLVYLIENENNYEETNLNLSEFLSQVDKFFVSEMKYKHQINVEKDIDEDLFINVVPRYLQDAVIEVLDNCIKYTNEDKGEIKITVSHDDENAYIRFENNSSTIPDEILKKMGSEKIDSDTGYGVGILLSIDSLKKINSTLNIKNTDDGVLYEISIPKKS